MKKSPLTYLLLLVGLLPAHGQLQLIEQPDILFQQNKDFELVAVERQPQATVLDFRVHQQPDRWFIIGHDCMLRDEQGYTYPIRGLESPYGKQLDEKIFARHEGEIRVRLVFPAIPVNTIDIDMTGEVPTEHGIYGIRLDGRKWTDVLRPGEQGFSGDGEATDTLPVPTLRYGVATVRGHLQNFRKGMLRHVILYQNAATYQTDATELDTLWAPVSDEGDFTLQLPVVHEQPVAIGYEKRKAMICYVAPCDTTVVGLDMALINRPRRERRGHYSKVLSGPLAALANEYNWTQSGNDLRNLYDIALKDAYTGHPDPIGSNPKRVMPLTVSLRSSRRRRLSAAMQELMRLDDQLIMIRLYQYWLSACPYYISQRGVMARTLYNKRRKRWAASVEADKMEAYLGMFTSSKQLLCPHFMGMAHYLSGLPTMYPDYVDHEVNAYSLKQQLRKDFTQLDSVQLSQAQTTLPTAYRYWLNNYRERLARIAKAGSEHGDYRVCQLPKTQYDHEIFGKLCQRYRGRLMFLHFWYPTVNSGMADVRDIMLPLQREFADYDIAWVNIGRHNNENSWRLQLPQLRGDHYGIGIEGYPGTAIIYSAMEPFKMESHYLYVIVDEQGRTVYRRNRPTDLQDLRDELRKYAKVKTTD